MATKASRTPGPWRATSTGEVLAEAGGHICTCGDPDEHGNPVDQANAVLIAAAPDLLTVCKEAADLLHDRYGIREREGTPSSIILGRLRSIAGEARGGAE